MRKGDRESILFHWLHWDINVVEFYIYETLLRISTSIISLFIPIYLLGEVGYSLSETIGFFVILQIFFLLAVPFGGRVCAALGAKKTMALRLPFLAIYYYGLQKLSGDFAADMYFVVPLLFFYSTTGAWANVARDLFLSKHVLGDTPGKMLAFLRICMTGSTVVAPLLGGAISYFYGFDALFLGGTLLALAAGLPLFLTPDEHFRVQYRPKDLFTFIGQKVPRPYLLAEAGSIFSDVIMWIMWPIFLYFVLQNTAEMGALVTISSLASMGVAYFVGQKVAGKDAKKLLQRGVLVASGLFFLRVVFLNPFVIGFVNALNRIIEPIYRIPYDRAVYRMILHHQRQTKMANLKQLISETYYTLGVAVLWGASLFVERESTGFFLLLFFGASLLMLLMQQMAKVKFEKSDEKAVAKEEKEKTAEKESKIVESEK